MSAKKIISAKQEKKKERRPSVPVFWDEVEKTEEEEENSTSTFTGLKYDKN